MSRAKRQRQKANKRAARDAAQPKIPEITDADLAALLNAVTVRADCRHASTRSSADGIVLTRCAVAASVDGGCPSDCASFDRRPAGGLGI